MLRPRIREVCERCRGRLHPALMRIFILENLSRIEELAKAYAQHVGASIIRVLCDELRDLL
jgi:hypothetical protein